MNKTDTFPDRNIDRLLERKQIATLIDLLERKTDQK